MSTEMELPQPEQGQEQSELQNADAEHVELLRITGIRFYGDLKQFHEPNELRQRLEHHCELYGLTIDLPDKNTIRNWLIQSRSEHPGTIIIGQPPGG